MSLFEILYSYWDDPAGALDAMWETRDRRMDELPLLSSWTPTISICLTYVYFVKVLGPNFMRDRKPFDLKKFLIVYNFLQVLVNAWMVYMFLRSGWLFDYNLFCQPFFTGTEKADWMATVCYVYFINKFIDFIDTFAFVARKKFEHVSTLHVFHHAIMPISTWIGVRFVPGGHGTFYGLINSFIHVCMYTYYTLAALGPDYAKYTWWKRHLTQLQLVQFVLVILHGEQLLFTDCDYPRGYCVLQAIHAVIFIWLFADFYRKAYRKRANKEKKEIQVQQADTLAVEKEGLRLRNMVPMERANK